MKMEEIASAAVVAKPESPKALKPGAAICPETGKPSEFSVGKVTARKNQVCDQAMRTIAESTKVAVKE